VTRIVRWLFFGVALFAARGGSVTPAAAQEGDATIAGTLRHGYFFTSPPNISLHLYCGLDGGTDQEVAVFRRPVGGNEWVRVGMCDSARPRGADTIAARDTTVLFISVLAKKASLTPGSRWSGTKTIADEVSNACGIRLMYSDSTGKRVRVILLNDSMAFGHGVPITKVCDPVLDHYNKF
jgi:hypothetical protein